MLNEILRNTDVQKAISFGSYAKNTPSKISDIDSNGKIKELKSLTNRIVHDYDGINLSIIWNFLNDDLDELEEQIKCIINNITEE